MYSLIDNLIFPAPKSSYDLDAVRGRIVFVPKFETCRARHCRRSSAASPSRAMAGVRSPQHPNLQILQRDGDQNSFLQKTQSPHPNLRHNLDELRRRTNQSPPPRAPSFNIQPDPANSSNAANRAPTRPQINITDKQKFEIPSIPRSSSRRQPSETKLPAQPATQSCQESHHASRICPAQQMGVNRTNVLSQLTLSAYQRGLAQAQKKRAPKMNRYGSVPASPRTVAGEEGRRKQDGGSTREDGRQREAALGEAGETREAGDGESAVEEGKNQSSVVIRKNKIAGKIRPLDFEEDRDILPTDRTPYLFDMRQIKNEKLNRSQIEETDTSTRPNKTKWKSGISRHRLELRCEPAIKIINEPSSPEPSASSHGPEEQEQSIQSSVNDRDDPSEIAQAPTNYNLTTLKNIKKMYAQLKSLDTAALARQKKALSSTTVEPAFRAEARTKSLSQKRPFAILRSPYEAQKYEPKKLFATAFMSPCNNNAYADSGDTKHLSNHIANSRDEFELYENRNVNHWNSHGKMLNSENAQKNQTSNGRYMRINNQINISDSRQVNKKYHGLNVNLPPRSIPKTTKSQFCKKVADTPQIEAINDHYMNQASFSQNDDSINNSPPSQAQDFHSFQKSNNFNYFDENYEHRGIDSISAHEPYKMAVNPRSKSQMAKKTAPMKQNMFSKVHEFQSQKKIFHENLNMLNEQEKLAKQKKDMAKVGKSDFLPCLFYQGTSDKVLIHFHANGEDIGHTIPLIDAINDRLQLSCLCVEYPGYGIYEDDQTGLTEKHSRSKQIQIDAEIVFKFVRDTCNVAEENILLMGRSIGSGPACFLASKFPKICALVLISPIKSVKEVARKNYGRIIDLLLEERFDNFEVAKTITCPTFICHGLKDRMVPYQHSVELLMDGFFQSRAHLFIREEMEHNRFDYENDIICPLKYFLKVSKICTDPKNARNVRDRDVENQQNAGYVDFIAHNYERLFGVKSSSEYYNNFTERFRPPTPKKNSRGAYIVDKHQPQALPQNSQQNSRPVSKIDQDKFLTPILAFDEQENITCISPTRFLVPHAMNLYDRKLQEGQGEEQQDLPPQGEEDEEAKDLMPLEVGQEGGKGRSSTVQMKFEASEENHENLNQSRMYQKSTEKVKSKQHEKMKGGGAGSPTRSRAEINTGCAPQESPRVCPNEEEEFIQTDEQEKEAPNKASPEIGGLSPQQKIQYQQFIKETIQIQIQSIVGSQDSSLMTSAGKINDEFRASIRFQELMEKAQQSKRLTPINELRDLNQGFKAKTSERIDEFNIEATDSGNHSDDNMVQVQAVSATKKWKIPQNVTNQSMSSVMSKDEKSQVDDTMDDTSNQVIDDDESVFKNMPGRIVTPFKKLSSPEKKKFQMMNEEKLKQMRLKKLKFEEMEKEKERSLLVKVDPCFFKTPSEQIKEEKTFIENNIKAAQAKQNKYKENSGSLKLMLNRCNVSQVYVGQKLVENNLNSGRMTPNQHLCNISQSKNKLYDSLTDRTLRPRSTLSKNVEPKRLNQQEIDPVYSSFHNEATDDFHLNNQSEDAAYHSTNQSPLKINIGDKYSLSFAHLDSAAAAAHEPTILESSKMLETPKILEKFTLGFGEERRLKIHSPQSSNYYTKMNLKNRHKTSNPLLQRKRQKQGEQQNERKNATLWQKIGKQSLQKQMNFEDLANKMRKAPHKEVKKIFPRKSIFLYSAEPDVTRSPPKPHESMVQDVSETGAQFKEPKHKEHGQIAGLHSDQQPTIQIINSSTNIGAPSSFSPLQHLEKSASSNLLAIDGRNSKKLQMTQTGEQIIDQIKKECQIKYQTPFKASAAAQKSRGNDLKSSLGNSTNNWAKRQNLSPGKKSNYSPGGKKNYSPSRKSNQSPILKSSKKSSTLRQSGQLGRENQQTLNQFRASKTQIKPFVRYDPRLNQSQASKHLGDPPLNQSQASIKQQQKQSVKQIDEKLLVKKIKGSKRHVHQKLDESAASLAKNKNISQNIARTQRPPRAQTGQPNPLVPSVTNKLPSNAPIEHQSIQNTKQQFNQFRQVESRMTPIPSQKLNAKVLDSSDQTPSPAKKPRSKLLESDLTEKMSSPHIKRSKVVSNFQNLLMESKTSRPRSKTYKSSLINEERRDNCSESLSTQLDTHVRQHKQLMASAGLAGTIAPQPLQCSAKLGMPAGHQHQVNQIIRNYVNDQDISSQSAALLARTRLPLERHLQSKPYPASAAEDQDGRHQVSAAAPDQDLQQDQLIDVDAPKNHQTISGRHHAGPSTGNSPRNNLWTDSLEALNIPDQNWMKIENNDLQNDQESNRLSTYLAIETNPLRQSGKSGPSMVSELSDNEIERRIMRSKQRVLHYMQEARQDLAKYL